MSKILEEKVDITIASGQTSGRVSFKPRAGRVIACAIFTNGAESAAGFVTAKITTDSGEEISPATHIKNYRDREAGYLEGKKPLDFETKNKSYNLEIFASQAFASTFLGQLVLVYDQRSSEMC